MLEEEEENSVLEAKRLVSMAETGSMGKMQRWPENPQGRERGRESITLVSSFFPVLQPSREQPPESAPLKLEQSSRRGSRGK